MKRNENESFEDYQERRKAENLRVKNYLKGRYLWFSKSYGYGRNSGREFNRGTYIKSVNGELS